MSIQLPSGLTAQQVIDGLAELLAVGLDALGQPELAALAPLAGKLADAIVVAVQEPSAAAVLSSEVQAEQLAADAAETAKFPKG
jgi:hypothetical protein